MTLPDLLGTAGVLLLLVAFALNIYGKLGATSRPYLLLNGVGAMLTGISSYLIAFWPFVVLEGVWMLSSFAALLKTRRA